MTNQNGVRFLDRSTPPHISTLILLAGLSAMVMNVFLPSLPGIARHFDAPYGLIQLAVTGWLAFNAFLTLLVGPISDRLGRRKVVLAGTIVFILATIGCLLATTVWAFLFFRMLQATMAVGMVIGRATIRDMYAQDRAASMIGYVTMGMALVPMIAPATGGALDEAFGWQASFWLLLGLGILMLWLTWADMGETSRTQGRTFAEQLSEYPELFASVRFWGYALTAAFASGAFFSYLGGGPLVGYQVFGMGPRELGFYFGAPAVGYFVGNFITGRYAARLGINRLILWGSILNAGGVGVSLVIFLTGYGTALSFFAFMTFVGLGNGMVIPNATAGMLSVRPRLAGTASGLGGAIMLGGGAALGTVAGIVLQGATVATPLLWLMFLTSLAAVVSIIVTIRRERAVTGQG